MITFDNKGYLIPNSKIECSFSEFKFHFVDSITSKTRLEIFNNFVDYANELKELLGVEQLCQWINGSFVTRVSNPQDIDFVTFVNFDLFEKYEFKLKSFVSNRNWRAIGIDAYIVQVYPVEHGLYSFYESDRSYWIDKFDSTRRNCRTGIKSPKGFLEINF
jgi:hypothetical protein